MTNIARRAIFVIRSTARADQKSKCRNQDDQAKIEIEGVRHGTRATHGGLTSGDSAFPASDL